MPRAAIVSPSERSASFRFEQRLHRPAEFSAVLTARQVVRGECFDLHYRQVGTGTGARIGLMVPKRLARTASLRNAIKRQGREVFRVMAIEIPPCDLILRLTRPVTAGRGNEGNQRKVWRKEIESLLRRLSAQSR